MNTNATVLHDRDVNYGVDFEVARDALLARAGKAFQEYMALRDDRGAAPAAISAAMERYCAARSKALALRVTDAVAIKSALNGTAQAVSEA